MTITSVVFIAWLTCQNQSSTMRTQPSWKENKAKKRPQKTNKQSIISSAYINAECLIKYMMKKDIRGWTWLTVVEEVVREDILGNLKKDYGISRMI